MNRLSDKKIVNSIELEELLKQREAGEIDFILVDVREDMEHKRAHIKGVDILRPTSLYYEWAAELMEMSRDKTLIFTCRTDHRSGQIQSAFRANGFENSINHSGGIVSYRGELVRL